MFEVARTLATAWHWLAGAIRTKRQFTNHRREAKEQ
jgi:hypothetical protein